MMIKSKIMYSLCTASCGSLYEDVAFMEASYSVFVSTILMLINSDILK